MLNICVQIEPYIDCIQYKQCRWVSEIRELELISTLLRHKVTINSSKPIIK